MTPKITGQRFRELAEAKGGQTASTGSSDLFRTAVDNLLKPWVQAVGEKGYKFSPERFGEQFGLQRRRPKSASCMRIGREGGVNGRPNPARAVICAYELSSGRCPYIDPLRLLFVMAVSLRTNPSFSEAARQKSRARYFKSFVPQSGCLAGA